MIKIILWDIDATLLDFLKSENMALKKAFARFDLGECTDSTVAEYSAINQSYWNRLETGELTKEQVLVGRFEEFLNVKGFCDVDDVDANEFCEFYESSLPDCVEFIGNAEETIKALSNSYYQYAVTNGAKNVQTKKLAVSGIDGIFNGAFISDDVGYAKPSKEFFNFVLQNIPKVSDDEILIVGDSLTSDIKGGNNMGFKTCWFNPHNLPLSNGYSVDYQIDNIDSIFDVLKQENS